MYSVMLVDDEKLILQGLMNIIEWEDIGLRVVQTAQNGYDALEIFKDNPVDIIITDINMPKLTGLELIREVRNINSKTKFIILTGYDEFTYAREAIKYGVESYILKPIDEDELQETLVKIKKDLENKNNEMNKLIDKNNKLIKYMSGKSNENYIYSMKDILSINIEGQTYNVANIIINNKEEDYLYIDKIIKKYTIEKCEIIHSYDNQVILINSWEKNTSKDTRVKYYENIKEKLIEELNKEVFISIGNNVEDIKKLGESYNKAKKLKKYTLTEGINKCIYEEKIKCIKEKKINFKEEIENINKLIIGKNSKDIGKYILNVLLKKDLTPQNIYDFSIKLIILVNDIYDEFKLDKKYAGDSLSSLIIELCNENSRENIKSFLTSEIEELIEIMSINSERYSPIIQQIVNVINNKYYEDITLKALAKKYNVNNSYLGQMFAKETGNSFSEHLNKVKNSKAKELILNTNMRINDIANAVGYIDTSYFYRKFKNHYGVSPSTLRGLKSY